MPCYFWYLKRYTVTYGEEAQVFPAHLYGLFSGFTDSEKQRAWPSRYKRTYKHKKNTAILNFLVKFGQYFSASLFGLFFAIIFWCPKITGNHSETVLLVLIWCVSSLFDHSKLVQSTVHLCTSALNLMFTHSHSYRCTLGQLTVVQCLAKRYFDMHTRGAGDWTTDLPIGRWATLPAALSIQLKHFQLLILSSVNIKQA